MMHPEKQDVCSIQPDHFCLVWCYQHVGTTIVSGSIYCQVPIAASIGLWIPGRLLFCRGHWICRFRYFFCLLCRDQTSEWRDQQLNNLKIDFAVTWQFGKCQEVHGDAELDISRHRSAQSGTSAWRIWGEPIHYHNLGSSFTLKREKCNEQEFVRIICEKNLWIPWILWEELTFGTCWGDTCTEARSTWRSEPLWVAHKWPCFELNKWVRSVKRFW